tara:strand:- start:215 stop:577 length:363 start_codon:yes stop_codon:yes gene_type:complete
MGVNSTDTAWNFGQMGSILIDSSTGNVLGDNFASSTALASGAVVVAITMITEVTFHTSNTQGLIGETEQMFIGSNSTSTDLDSGAGIVTDSIVFPAGITIYGRWSKVKLASGTAIAYIGY